LAVLMAVTWVQSAWQKQTYSLMPFTGVKNNRFKHKWYLNLELGSIRVRKWLTPRSRITDRRH